MARMAKVRRYYLELSRHGFSAVGLDARGRSVNVINGGIKDSAVDILRAAKLHWPGAKRVLRSSIHPLTRRSR